MINAAMKLSTESDNIFRFTDMPLQSVSHIGGKGASLCAMSAAGLPVPAGVCLSVALFDDFAAHIELLTRFDLTEGYEQWQAAAKAIKESPLPNTLQDAISAAIAHLKGPLAVRSSALDEDGESSSFAGQHLTKLALCGLDTILDAIKECWSSAFSEAAYRYRQHTDKHLDMPRMAVVVQQMQFGDVSGVAFGQHPTTFARDAFLVENCFGLCEGLVSGQVVSDSWQIDKESGEVREVTIADKSEQIIYLDGEIQKVAVSDEQRQQPALGPMAQQALYTLLCKVEAYFGVPQDVEWTWSEGKIWLLQSRPITTHAPQLDDFYLGSRDVDLQKTMLWSRMDIGEIFTGRMTPLGLSFARYYQQQVHTGCGKGLGLLDLGEADETIAYYRGHVYLNVSYTAWQLAQTPIGEDQLPFLQRFSSEAIDLAGYRNPYGEKHSHQDYSAKQCTRYWLKKNIKELFCAKRRARSMIASRYKQFDRAQQKPLQQLSLEQLAAEMRHALAYFKAMHEGYLPYYINAFACYGILEELSALWLGDKGKQLHNQIKGDMSNLRTVASAQELWLLCQQLADWPQVKQAFLDLELDELEVFLNEHQAGIKYSRGPLAQFMRENGVRAREEMELTHPRWLDDRTYLLQMIKVYLHQGYAVDDAIATQQRKQRKNSNEILKTIPWYQRRVMKLVISLYSGCAKLREETRMSMVTSIWLVRRIVYELGQRLVATQQLTSMDDIAYLDFAEILSYLEKRIDVHQLTEPAKLAQRQSAYHLWQSMPEPPLTFIGSPKSQPDLILDPTLTQLSGLATSAGFCRGKACVITDLAKQAGQFKKGDILIAPFTDASWTPLFALAGAVVTDIGSMLSHSSIVAREFGIPCVVNTNHASALFKSGDMLIVDAQNGIVVLDKES